MHFILTALALSAYLVASLVQAEPSTIQLACQSADNAHCMYSPTAAQRMEDPTMSTTTGSVLHTERDGKGVITYLMMDGTTGSMLIFCNDGGSNRFNFSWAHGASSIVGDPYVHGNAKVYFNDMPSRLAGTGETIASSAAGIDATVTCPH
ncbi:hypothetical protein BDZ90DRAFT_261419 [Jaminaea rosea]|uniref:Secreted protein n=1 Tax=Jaminaea rosea TaxID=1569628 RepID=A0A316UMV8_9BASI|nr:hypothetical protein BDZ90DRAFT_261419 [Jaminaea rosea]PWN26617.1 hypothetical protein BDZ90DRAFT_261419 [Jaminaea rosea]